MTDLTVLHAAGFTATVDAYALEPDPDPLARRMRLWFVSLLGPQQTVRRALPRLPNNVGSKHPNTAPAVQGGWELSEAFSVKLLGSKK